MATLGVVGTGLIGCSIALLAKQTGAVSKVVGIDTDQVNLDRAIELDQIAGPITAYSNLNLVCIAVPTSHISDCVRDVSRKVHHSVPIFDVGSVKTNIVERLAPRVPSNFVPCHPIAGSEKSGPEAADAELFQGARCILTPVDETSTSAITRVETFWRQLGVTTITQTPEAHDKALAMTSHLPHLLSSALVQLVADQEIDIQDYAGNAYRDFTRIARADPDVWASIFTDNRDELRQQLSNFNDVIQKLGALIDNKDPGLRSALAEIREFSKQSH